MNFEIDKLFFCWRTCKFPEIAIAEGGGNSKIVGIANFFALASHNVVKKIPVVILSDD